MDEQLAQLRADVERASAPRVVVARAAVLRLLDEVAIRRPVQDLDALTGYTPPRPEPHTAAPPRRVVQPPPGRGRAILAVTGEDAARLAQVELTVGVGDGRTPPTRAVLTPDHALWIAEQLRAAARLAAKA